MFDFEPVMHKNVPPAHFGYMATGIDDEVTLRANREGFQKFQLLPRRLVDVSQLDLTMELFGRSYGSPVVLAPTGSNKAFHEDGDLAVSRAARRTNNLQILSTVATASIEQAIEARGRPVWFQLYPTNKWAVAEALAKRAETAGRETIVVTVDVLARQNWETYVRLWRTDKRNCAECHGLGLASFVKRKPNFDGLDLSGIDRRAPPTSPGTFIKRLRDTVKTKLVLKGLMTAADAILAVDNGLDAIVVSNHGGRDDDFGRSTIDALPEIIEAVDGRIPVLVDSGFRRGTDIVKALALGARAVCIGRPYLWGLGAFGQAGVERVLDLLQQETRAAMQQVGARALKQLGPALVKRASYAPPAIAATSGPRPRPIALGPPSRLEQEPHALLGLVDPVLDQAGGGDVAMLVGDLMEDAHVLEQLLVVVAQLGQHVGRRYVLGVVVEHALQALDVADRLDGRGAELAHPLGDDVGHGVDLGRLVVEQQMVVAEMRARDVPVEILGLEIERDHVGQQDVEAARHVLAGVGAKVVRRGEVGGPAGLGVFGHGLKSPESGNRAAI